MEGDGLGEDVDDDVEMTELEEIKVDVEAMAVVDWPGVVDD